MGRALIILSIVLPKQLVSTIGLKLPGPEWSLPGLGIGMTFQGYRYKPLEAVLKGSAEPLSDSEHFADSHRTQASADAGLDFAEEA